MILNEEDLLVYKTYYIYKNPFLVDAYSIIGYNYLYATFQSDQPSDLS